MRCYLVLFKRNVLNDICLAITMALTESTMVKLGSSAHDFSLPDTNGNNVNLTDFKSDSLVVIFTCNHCPYAKAVEDRLIILGNDYQDKADFVLISSNEVENYPDDTPEKMAETTPMAEVPAAARPGAPAAPRQRHRKARAPARHPRRPPPAAAAPNAR